ncbi:MAG: ATP-binding protein, partial [Actinobacteria bacterium]
TLDRALELFYRQSPAARERGAHVFLDEIQVVDGWERFARRVLDTERVHLTITGSSARMLSTEVATEFRGRGLAVEVLPFSAAERARALGPAVNGDAWPPGAALRSSLAAAFGEYLACGGFPSTLRMNEYDRIQSLQGFVETVVLRDVAERHSATNLSALRALVEAAFAANAGPFSVSRLHGMLRSRGHAVTKATLLTYLDHVTDAYLLFLLPLRTRSARQRAVNPRKVYAIDPGLAAAVTRAGASNLGARFENAVYLELRHRLGGMTGTALTYYRTADGLEVDFAVDLPSGDGTPLLYQVCADPSEPETMAREMRALEGAMRETGASAATLLTVDAEGEYDVRAGRVDIVPAWRWFYDPERPVRALRV